ncbi:hypothetical protein [Ferrimonas pelagia]|uniref:Ig-like domain (Group 2) n=1 Tax=Ferrimonas pelagia TaxID=1177826 RepID=A0ABP9EB07_9GAMM
MIRFFTLIPFVLALTGCFVDTSDEDRIPPPLAHLAWEIPAEIEAGDYDASHTLMAHYTDGSQADVTYEARYDSSNSELVWISGSGIHSDRYSAGSAALTARYRGGEARAMMIVHPHLEGIELELPRDLFHGTEYTPIVTANYADGSAADVTEQTQFRSDDTTVVEFIEGVLHTHEVGSAYVYAEFGEYSEAQYVYVNPELTDLTWQAPQRLEQGEQYSHELTAHFSDGTSQNVNWEAEYRSGNEDVATADSNYLTAHSIGETSLTANYGEREASLSIEVVEALVIDRIEMELHPDLLVGGQYPATTTVFYTDGSQDQLHEGVHYSSSPSWTARFYGNVLHANDDGEVTLTASYGGHEHSFERTINEGGPVNPLPPEPVATQLIWLAPAKMEVGTEEGHQLRALYDNGFARSVTQDAQLDTSNSSVASFTVEGINALAEGESTLTASYGELTAEHTLTVTQSAALDSISLMLPEEMEANRQYSASVIARYADGIEVNVSQRAEFSSSNDNLASFEGRILRTHEMGNVTLTASFEGQTASVARTIAEEVLLEGIRFEAPELLYTGHSYTTQVIAKYSDGSESAVLTGATTSSSDTEVANFTGLELHANTAGSVTLIAEYQDFSDALERAVEIDPATIVTDIKLSLSEGPYYAGHSYALSLIASYADDSTQDVTEQAQWRMPESEHGHIDGRTLHLQQEGQLTIGAHFEGFTDSTSITIDTDPATILTGVEVQLDGDAPHFVNQSHTLSLIATYADDSTQDLAEEANWTLSDETLASREGTTLSLLKAGELTITGATQGFDHSLSINIREPGVAKLTIYGDQLAKPAGAHYSWQVWADMSDGSEVEVTDRVNWSYLGNSPENCCEELEGEGILFASGGQFRTLLPATYLITAELDDVQAERVLWVKDPTVVEIYPVASYSEGDEAVQHELRDLTFSMPEGESFTMQLYQRMSNDVVTAIEGGQISWSEGTASDSDSGVRPLAHIGSGCNDDCSNSQRGWGTFEARRNGTASVTITTPTGQQLPPGTSGNALTLKTDIEVTHNPNVYKWVKTATWERPTDNTWYPRGEAVTDDSILMLFDVRNGSTRIGIYLVEFDGESFSDAQWVLGVGHEMGSAQPHRQWANADKAVFVTGTSDADEQLWLYDRNSQELKEIVRPQEEYGSTRFISEQNHPFVTEKGTIFTWVRPGSSHSDSGKVVLLQFNEESGDWVKTDTIHTDDISTDSTSYWAHTYMRLHAGAPNKLVRYLNRSQTNNWPQMTVMDMDSGTVEQVIIPERPLVAQDSVNSFTLTGNNPITAAAVDGERNYILNWHDLASVPDEIPVGMPNTSSQTLLPSGKTPDGRYFTHVRDFQDENKAYWYANLQKRYGEWFTEWALVNIDTDNPGSSNVGLYRNFGLTASRTYTHIAADHLLQENPHVPGELVHVNTVGLQTYSDDQWSLNRSTARLTSSYQLERMGDELILIENSSSSRSSRFFWKLQMRNPDAVE